MILAPDASPPRPAFRGRRDGRSPEGRPKVESMKTPIKKALMQVGLEQPARSLYWFLRLFMRAYGHQFIHDWGVLRGMLEQSGFSNVVRCGLNESDDAAFRNLANDGRMQAGFLALQSLTLEASKLRAICSRHYLLNRSLRSLCSSSRRASTRAIR